MSLAKAVPDGPKDRECQIASPQCPPIPYVPEKDCFQETVSGFRDNISRHRLAKVWSYMFLSGTLGHVKHSSFTIRRQGYFKAHGIANKAYME
jgi:hypothetical protein